MATKRTRRRRLVLPGWAVVGLLIASVVVVVAVFVVIGAGAVTGWRWLDGRGWLPGWAQLVLAAFAVGVAARMLRGAATGRAWVRSTWGAWRRRLGSLS